MSIATCLRATLLRPAAFVLFGTLTLTVLLVACDEAESTMGASPPHSMRPDFTMGVGTQSTLLGRGTFDEAFRVKRSAESADLESRHRRRDRWQVEVEAKPNLDIAVQSITFQPGGHSGWHRHPGPVFIQVVSGTMTFYDSNDRRCRPIVRAAGQGFLDTGEFAHIARNETTSPAQNVVVYFAPVGEALRIDAPDPGHCPF